MRNTKLIHIAKYTKVVICLVSQWLKGTSKAGGNLKFISRVKGRFAKEGMEKHREKRGGPVGTHFAHVGILNGVDSAH